MTAWVMFTVSVRNECELRVAVKVEAKDILCERSL